MYAHASKKLVKIFHLNYLTSFNLSVIFTQITIWKAKPLGKDLAARNGHQGGPFPTHLEATGWCHRCPQQPRPPRSERRLCPSPVGSQVRSLLPRAGLGPHMASAFVQHQRCQGCIEDYFDWLPRITCYMDLSKCLFMIELNGMQHEIAMKFNETTHFLDQQWLFPWKGSKEKQLHKHLRQLATRSYSRKLSPPQHFSLHPLH